MDLIKSIGAFQPFFELQKYADSYGIILEGLHEQKGKSLSDFDKYVVKFSIPESWESGISGKENQISPNELKNTFKSKMNSAMIQMWKMNGQDFEDDFFDEVTEFFVYLCRTRKGEVWTCEKRNAALENTEKKINEATNFLKQSEEYESV